MARHLSRPLSLPEIHNFHDLVEVVPKGQGEIRVPAEDYNTRTGKRRKAYMTIGPYLSRRPGYHALNVRAFPRTVEAIVRNTISIAYDSMSFEIIVWDLNEALFLSSHSKIIGAVWLSIIDPLTIPDWATRQSADALRYAREEGTSDAYRVAADAFYEDGEDSTPQAVMAALHAEDLAAKGRDGGARRVRRR